MSLNLKIEKAKIFPSPVLAGITKKNASAHFPNGISFHSIQNKKGQVANIEILSRALGISPDGLKFQNLTHSDIVRLVGKDSKIENSDALISSEKALCLCVKIADCCGILLYDKGSQAIASIHSGWRGTAQNITEKCIQKMAYHFDTRAENLLAYISPCGSACCYEVGADVARFFPSSIKQISEEKYLLDLKNEVKNQMLNAGILEENIEISKDCTICNPDYHSYRRDKENSGRGLAFIVMI